MSVYGWPWTLVTSDKSERVNMSLTKDDPWYAFWYCESPIVTKNAIKAPLPLYFQPQGDTNIHLYK